MNWSDMDMFMCIGVWRLCSCIVVPSAVILFFLKCIACKLCKRLVSLKCCSIIFWQFIFVCLVYKQADWNEYSCSLILNSNFFDRSTSMHALGVYLIFKLPKFWLFCVWLGFLCLHAVNDADYYWLKLVKICEQKLYAEWRVLKEAFRVVDKNLLSVSAWWCYFTVVTSIPFDLWSVPNRKVLKGWTRF